MFSDSKYTRWYFSIIDRSRLKNRAKKEGYFEEHHIVPRSMGGTNEKRNRVLLTAREHFICHLLLTKMTSGLNKRNMSFALSIMATRNRYFPKSSRLYETVRLLASKARLEYWKELRTDETAYAKRCEITRQSQLGKLLSNEHKEKLRSKSEEAGARYTIESPCGEIFKPVNLAAFCRERSLSHVTIKQAYWHGKGDKRVQKGPSMGWRITEVNK